MKESLGSRLRVDMMNVFANVPNVEIIASFITCVHVYTQLITLYFGASIGPEQSLAVSNSSYCITSRFNAFTGGVLPRVWHAWQQGMTQWRHWGSTSINCCSQFETRCGQRRVVMVNFVHNFRLETFLSSFSDRSSSCHVYPNPKLSGQATDEGKSKKCSVGIINILQSTDGQASIRGYSGGS